METKGHCKHGEFTLTEGCPLCIEERRATRNKGGTVMFEQAIAELKKDLVKLLADRKKLEEVMPGITNPDVKARAEIKYIQLDNLINRAGVCQSILESETSLEISDDFFTIRYPRPMEPKTEPKQAGLI